MEPTKRYSRHVIENALSRLARQDRDITWDYFVEQGIKNTQESVHIKRAKFTPLLRLLPWLFAAGVIAGIAMYIYAVINVHSNFYDAYRIDDERKEGVAQSVINQRFNFKVLGFAGIGTTLISAVSCVFTAAMSSEVSKDNARVKKELELPSSVTYDAKVEQQGDSPVAVITRTYPVSSTKTETQTIINVLLSDEPVQAVEELDELMLQLKELQTSSYQKQMNALIKHSLQTKAQQREYFQSLKDELKQAQNKKNSVQGLVATLDQHAAHHNKVNKEIFDDELLAVLQDEIPTQTKTARTSEAA